MNKHLNLNVLKTKIGKHEKKIILNNIYNDHETSKFFKDHKKKKDQDFDDGCNTLIETQGIVYKKRKLQIESNRDNMFNSDKKNRKNFLNEYSVWFPKNWKKQLKNIREMRKHCTAPVDTMGCHKCSDELVNSSLFRYQTLVALMLSSQTKDQVTYKAMQRLKENRCTPEYVNLLSDEELGKLIYPVSFWKRKVQYLKETSKIILQKYNGDIPTNVQELCDLPGVGQKMANICMQVAWNKIVGIGVDTHVHRIVNRLQWLPKQTKTPEETRLALESWLPKELWTDINYLFVGFGQEICRSQRPKCSECMNKPICPYANNIYIF